MQRIYLSLLTCVLLLTLVGQAVASVAMSCEMPHMNQTHESSKSEMINEMHHTMSPSMMNMDCCDDDATGNQECSCPISACSAYSMLSSDGLFITVLPPPEKVQLYTLQNQHSIASSLYRPPMVA